MVVFNGSKTKMFKSVGKKIIAVFSIIFLKSKMLNNSSNGFFLWQMKRRRHRTSMS